MGQQIVIVILGLIAGFLSGLLGIGGAIVIIPALVLFLNFSQQMAQGTTLVMLVLPVGALAAWQYYRAGNADMKVALVLAISFFVSGFFGAKLANQIPQEVLKKAFAVTLILVALYLLFFDKAIK